ncbi:MAG: NBR1-Ig-like domain-containing protein [Anaerolineales bacterium]
MRFGWILLAGLGPVLGACSLSAAARTASPVTEAALTVGAVFTQMAGEGQLTETALASSPSPEAPGTTLAETAILTSPPSPSPVSTAVACYWLRFEADVTLPDDSPVQPGATLVKTWRLLNTGSCPWTADTQVVFVSGDRMAGPLSQPIGQTVAVGAEALISVTLTAPEEPGTYLGYWMLLSPDETRFGYGPAADQAFWVEIVVLGTPVPTATPTPTLTGTPGPMSSATPSSTPTLQSSATPTWTSTVALSPTSTQTSTVASSPTSTQTSTPAPSSSPTPPTPTP